MGKLSQQHQRRDRQMDRTAARPKRRFERFAIAQNVAHRTALHPGRLVAVHTPKSAAQPIRIPRRAAVPAAGRSTIGHRETH